MTIRKSPYSDSMAHRVIARFGGALRLAQALKAVGRPKDPSVIYRWTYSRADGGADGIIPTKAWYDIMAAAHHEGILITMDDFNPGFRKLKDPELAKPKLENEELRGRPRKEAHDIPPDSSESGTS